MTWLDLARQYFRGASEAELNALLWNATCFPFGTPEQVEAHLLEAAWISDGKVGVAIAGTWTRVVHDMAILKAKGAA